MGDLAAYLIANLKKGIGNVYIHSLDISGVGEDYTYTLYEDLQVIRIEISSRRSYRSIDKALSGITQEDLEWMGG